ncbi:MAG: M56 family metallopeptidase, partial [Acetanaerobacterium sp.]
MLRTVFLLVVSMSIAGSVAAAGVLLLKALLRDRLPARTGCYVWLVAIALFLLPLRQLVPGIPPSAAQSTVYNSSIINSVTLPQNTESAEPTTALQSPFRDIRTPLGVIWAAGMLLYFGAKAVSYRRFRRQILRGAMPCGKDTQDALVLAMKRTNCQSPVRLFCRVGVQTPLTFGVARPIILLPGEHIPPERLEMILTHELVHIRQHDLLYKLCSMLAAGIHWFNPFAHLMAADIDDACELRCDREVVRILGEERKKSYCELLIDTAILPCTSENGLFTASLGRRRKLIKRRVYSIMTANACRPALKAVIIACVVAASALGVACSPMVEIPDSTNVHIEDVPDVVDVSSTNDADNSTKPADDTLLCTVVEKYYTGDDPTPISVKTKTISLPTWMEEQEIGYSVESRYSGEGHTVVTYMLADVDEDANVPEWYHVQWQMTQERRLSEEPLDEI